MEVATRQDLLNDLYSLRAGIALIATQKEKVEEVNRQFKQKKSDTTCNLFKQDLGDSSEYNGNTIFYPTWFKGKYYDWNQEHPFIFNDCYEDIKFENIPPDSSLHKFKFEEGETLRNYIRNNKSTYDEILYICRRILSYKYKLSNTDLLFGNLDSDLNYQIIKYKLEHLKIANGYFERKKHKNRIKDAEKWLTVTLPQARELCIELENQRKEAIRPIIDKAKNIYKIFSDKYKSMLFISDWADLDLVIYYLQTNRAESVKEALQQVDQQKQTEAIVGAMEKATSEICKTIRTEISSLKTAITQRLDTIIEQNNTIIAQNDVMIAQGELQTALLAKMASSSAKLMAEVKVIVS